MASPSRQDIRNSPEIGFVSSDSGPLPCRGRQNRVLTPAKLARSQPTNGESGFALLLVFLMAAVVAISLYMEIPRVAFEAQRQKEQLLIDRGEQYKRAIQVFFVNNKRYPGSMDELKNLNGRRYLRQQYLDPMTGKSEWRLVHINGGVFTDSLLNAPKQGQPGQGQQGQAQQAQGQQNQPSAGAIAGSTYVGEGQQGIGAALNPQQQSVNMAMRRRASDGGAAPVDPLTGLPLPGNASSGGFPPQADSSGNVIGGAYPAGSSPNQTAQTGVAPGVPMAPGSFPAAQPSGALMANSAQAYAANALQAMPGAGQPGTGIGGAPGYAPSGPGPGFPGVGQQPSVPTNPPLPAGIQFGSQPFQSSQQAAANPSTGGSSSYIGGGSPYIGGGSYVGGQSPIAGAQGSAFGSAPFSGQNFGTAFPGAPVNSQTGGVSPSPMIPPASYSGLAAPPIPQTPYSGLAAMPSTASYSTQPGAQGVSPGFPQPGIQAGGSAPGQPGAPGQTPASQMIWNILTSPRTNVGQGGAAAQNAQIGGGIAGIASKAEDEGIMIYDDRSKYNEWEFVFDLTKYRPPPNPLAGSVGTAASQLGSINPASNASGGTSGASGPNAGGQQGIGASPFGNSAPQGGQTPFGSGPSTQGSQTPGTGGAFPPAGQTGLPEIRLGQP